MTALQVLRFMRDQEAGVEIKAAAGVHATSLLAPDNVTSRRVVDVSARAREYDDEPDPWSEVWIPTADSTGTRQPTPRTKGHCRGWLVDPATNRAVGFESTHEMRVAAMLMANRCVVNVEDQPQAFSYPGADGKNHLHTFDYRATYVNGRRIAIAVKPRKDVEKSGIRSVLKAVRPVLRDFAHEAILLTDVQATNTRGWNAMSILRARRARNEEDCARMRHLLRGVHGTVHASHLAAQFGNTAAGMNAIWCLIYDGVLRHLHPDRKFVDAPYVATVSATQ
ncbi:hypothetical protein I6F15_07395 [Bradyrhizobium sp. BRP14]|nr:hypothetical protein [Bradyrhizobium sp. BRP14]